MSESLGEHNEQRPEQYQVRLQKLQRLVARGEQAYKNNARPSHLAAALHERYDHETREQLERLKPRASLAGRVMAIRHFGKGAFLKIQDRSGVLQGFISRAVLGEALYAVYLELDLGDFIFSEGVIFKTKTQELSLQSEQLVLLTKGLRPLPEKFHGVADIEIKYRQRYLDLMVSAQTREVFRKRSQMIQGIRAYFLERDFLEVETPMMQAIAGGAAARPFSTHHNALNLSLFLRIAPELYLKRLVVGGFERVFEINRNFRNEGLSVRHNPEFTMLEFYQSYAQDHDMMVVLEELIARLSEQMGGGTLVTYQEHQLELKVGWRRLRLEESLVELGQFPDAAQVREPTALLQFAVKFGVVMDPASEVGEMQMAIFDQKVEPLLIQPTFITHYPLSVSPLSRKNDQDPFLADRFELFIAGREIANGFSELNDPLDQRERFERQAVAKAQGNLEACDVDEDFLLALEYGMPPTAGCGLGIDRLAMLLTNQASIRDVILFPLMRPQSHHSFHPLRDGAPAGVSVSAVTGESTGSASPEPTG